MFKLNRPSEAIIDFSNLVLGVFLFLSPWIFGFTSDLGWHTSWIAGTAISVIAIFSIGDLFASATIPSFIETEEWLNLAIGLWLAACPWILRFHGDPLAMRVHLAVGLVIVAIAVVELWLMHHNPPHERA
ncbi:MULTISPECIES: SPW repeat protein [unclassified Bradyrhizobium]|uniref:SPW repeat protein n=1 Tax=unclassified Bradyrhizobium TaxID=2631580 RepID=UPI001FFAB1AC|nr:MULTISPECIES: SPW repeat protein [unclassified Bradyrhizobium]MCK1709117.1 SPW repeat protein [Bradyrhizobium sp. 143]MCK1726411.1 SPW repeat protein [Bradyrhizobium sp. 142]